MTWKRSAAGGSSARMAVPMLPPICTSRPAARRMWAISAVVVDLPLVPVMAMNGASGAELGALAAEQLDVADDLDAGGLGLSDRPVRLGMGERHAGRQHEGREPASSRRRQILDGKARRRAASRPAALSSAATTVAPPAARARQVAMPEMPRPNTATVRPANVVMGVMRLSGVGEVVRSRDGASRQDAVSPMPDSSRLRHRTHDLATVGALSAASTWQARPAPAPRR